MRVIVIGAGPAGLAVAAVAGGAGHDPVVLERAGRIAPAWHRHYDRLHLHTPRSRSGLPGLAMPSGWPRYPSRPQVLDYLERYARHFRLAPAFNAEVQAILPDGPHWSVAHARGIETADAVVLATGLSGQPFRPDWPGSGGFSGPVMHASDYRNPDGLRDERVLVVGFGNSGGEIALDLALAGRAVDLVVRGPVNLLPRELLGVPIVSFGLLQKVLPYRIADALTAPVLRLAIGDYGRLGLRKSAKGPLAQIREDGRVPLIDIGTLAAIRRGQIRVRPGIDRIDGGAVTFADGAVGRYDAMLLATGYRVDLRPLLPEVDGVLDPDGRPLICGAPTARPGLFFCGYHASPAGQLLAIGREARAIVAALR